MHRKMKESENELDGLSKVDTYGKHDDATLAAVYDLGLGISEGMKTYRICGRLSKVSRNRQHPSCSLAVRRTSILVEFDR